MRPRPSTDPQVENFDDVQDDRRATRRARHHKTRHEFRRTRNRHLAHRQKNRGIDDELLDLVNTYGEATFVGDGRVIVRLTPDLIERLQKVYLVRDVSSGQVITAGHRFKRVKG